MFLVTEARTFVIEVARIAHASKTKTVSSESPLLLHTEEDQNMSIYLMTIFICI